MTRRLLRRALFLILSAGFAAGWTLSAEAPWPTHRGDPRRSGTSPIALSFPLHPQWSYLPAQGPKPAWPPPAAKSYWQQLESIEARVTDDHAFSPIVSEDALFFASSADDSLRSLALETGSLNWVFTTEGPLRYAPVFAQDRLFFGSDDGSAYCVDAATGGLVWKRRLAPTDERIPGNGRIISPWPLRGGMALEENRLYTTAGLYPSSQGAFAFCLDTADGSIVWESKLNTSPQGYLLLGGSDLVIPTGRSTPIALDKRTGVFKRAYSGTPGTFAVLTEDQLTFGRGNNNTMGAVNPETGARLAQFGGLSLAADSSLSYLLNRQSFRVIERERHAALTREIALLKTAVGRKSIPDEQRIAFSERIDRAQEAIGACERFDIDISGGQSVIAFRNAALLGTNDQILAIDPESGESRWATSVPSPVLALAATPDGFIASLETGELIAFGPESREPLVRRAKPDPRAPELSPAHQDLVASFASNQGYALVSHVKTGELAEAFALHTPLKVIAVDRDAGAAGRRARWIEMGIYGSKIATVDPESNPLPFTHSFANLVVSERLDLDRDAPINLQPFVQPYTGKLVVNGTIAPDPTDTPLGHGQWTHQFGNLANTASSGDALVTDDLSLQWFGGPGPRRMIDRHLRGPAPLFSRGTLVLFGENLAMGVDAYNGTELWELELGTSQRYSMPYDAGYASARGHQMALAVNHELWKINLRDGSHQVLATAPQNADADPTHHFGYVGWNEKAILVSIQKTTASRTQPSRAMIDTDYRHRQPVVTSQRLRALDPETGDPLWEQRETSILNATIAQDSGRVVYVATGRRSRTGRDTLETLLNSGARLVCRRVDDGELLWESPLDAPSIASENILFVAGADNRWILVGSYVGADNDSWYTVECIEASSGARLWTANHPKGKPGASTHGEQLHHPVVFPDGRLLAEPAVYDLQSGDRLLNRDGAPWVLSRPGHSCGTISASAQTAFFRAANPTALDLSGALSGAAKPRALAPTRPGCWINIIPAGGLALIPEASSGCVCHFSLQTSMAFKPAAVQK